MFGQAVFNPYADTESQLCPSQAAWSSTTLALTQGVSKRCTSGLISRVDFSSGHPGEWVNRSFRPGLGLHTKNPSASQPMRYLLVTLKLPGGNSGTRGGAGLQRASIVARERINIVRLARLSKNSSVRDHRNSVVTVTVANRLCQLVTSRYLYWGSIKWRLSHFSGGPCST